MYAVFALGGQAPEKWATDANGLDAQSQRFQDIATAADARVQIDFALAVNGFYHFWDSLDGTEGLV